MVKLRKFQEAVDVLKPVLDTNPKEDVAYFAHTNLATALQDSKGQVIALERIPRADVLRAVAALSEE